jgi:hypothetical protein
MPPTITNKRVAPAFAPALPLEPDYFRSEPPKGAGPIAIELQAKAVLNADGSVTVRGGGRANAGAGPAALSLFLDGVPIAAGLGAIGIDRTVPRGERGPLFRSLLCALAYGGDGHVAARFTEMP